MSEVTVDRALEIALEHQQKGEFPDAEDILRQVLLAYPDQSDALYLLGMLLYQQGRHAEAEHLTQRAVHLKPREAAYRLGRGLVLQTLRRIPEAVAEYRDAVELSPDFLEAHSHLGVALSLLGRYEEAVPEFQHVLAQAPAHVATQANLGIALLHLGRYDESILLLRSAIAQQPKVADHYANMATALHHAGQFEAAAAACRQAINLMPEHGAAHLMLSKTLHCLDQYKDSLDIARRAHELLPDSLDALINYAEALHFLGKLDEATTLYRNALKAQPNAGELHNNLACILKEQGDLDEAVAGFRRVMEIAPAAPLPFCNVLYSLQYHPTITQQQLFREHCEFDHIHVRPIADKAMPHDNDPDPNRRLRIAYVSSEFRTHALGFYLLPILGNHDKKNFEVFCYAALPREDSITYRFRQVADHWIDTRGMIDEEIAARIRRDKIDILLDVHQHMGGNRIMLFAYRAAPVQIAYAGYPGTSGLSTIGYRLTDQYLEPLDLPPVPSSEKVIRLPDTFWCYVSQGSEFPINRPPAEANGYITFGNLNNFCKLNPQHFARFAEILRQVPNSRLLLLTDEGAHRQRTRELFERHGIADERINFVPRQRPAGYFQSYHRIDIGLDSFPYTGHTTSLDSFFMGVPVVTLVGQTPVSRGGWSQLKNLGMTELAGHTPEEFIRIAVELANDLPRIAELRATLRERMKKSPLMDGPRYCRNIEAAYRQAWQEWCAGRKSAG